MSSRDAAANETSVESLTFIPAERAAVGSRSGILPSYPTPLLGRGAEVDMLCAALLQDEIRLLTLTGPGGVGKTRLAHDVAMNTRHAFPQGIYMVYLAEVSDAQAVLPTIARALGLPTADALSTLELVVEYLSTKRTLLLLNSFEHVLDAGADLNAVVARCPSVVVLVTSRAPLRVRWERAHAVLPLAVPNSSSAEVEYLKTLPCMQLFEQRAQLIRSTFALDESNALDVAAICRRLDGLPLAIELAAARTRILAPAAILARLDGQSTILKQSAPDAPDRHRSLETSMDWSYELLSAAEQTLLRGLSVFAGTFTLDAAIAVAGPEGGDVLESFSALVDNGLVGTLHDPSSDPSFYQLNTIRAYAAAQAVGCGEMEELQEKHYAYFLFLAEQSAAGIRGPGQHMWLARLDQAESNLQAALCWVEGRGEARLRLVVALLPFWRMRGHYREAIQYLNRAVSDRPGSSPALMSVALSGLGEMLLREGDIAAAGESLDEALALALPLQDSEAIASVLAEKGNLLGVQGRLEEGTRCMEDALVIWRNVGSDWEIGRAERRLAVIALAQGDNGRAETFLSSSVSLLRSFGDPGETAASLIVLSRTVEIRGDTAQAVKILSDGFNMARDVKNHSLLIMASEYVVALAAAHARPEAVAQLLGALDALRALTGLVRSPFAQSLYEGSIAGITARAGTERMQQWLVAGSRLSLAEATERTLNVLEEVATATRKSDAVAPGIERLTNREYEVLRLIADGFSNKRIALQIGISENTVKFHVTSLLSKLGADSRAQVVAEAMRLDLLGRAG